MQYFFINPDGQQSGPIEPEAFKKNGITGNTMVWCEGMGNWQAACNVPELKKYVGKSFLSLPVLIAISVILTIVLSVISIFAYAFIASIFNTFIFFIPIPVLIISVLSILFFLIKKYRHNFRTAFFLALPFFISSVISIVYYQGSCRYDNGYCEFYRGGNEGLLNKFGMTQLPCVYDRLTALDKNGNRMYNWRGELPYCFIAKKEHYGLITFSGEEILPFIFDDLDIWREGETDTPLLLAEKDDLNGIYNLAGETILKCEYSYICQKNEVTGCSQVNIGGSEDDDNNISGGKWGLIDKNGQLLVPCEYESISTYSNLGYIKAHKAYETDYYDFEGNSLRKEYDDY